MVPPLDEQGRALVNIGFIAYHKAVPIIDFRYLSGPSVVTLDWDDPWYTVFENPNLKRHHKSALMTFLYVEPYEVRHEILTRVKDLEAWMDIGLRGDEYIEVDELEPLQQRIGEFLMTKNVVRIDGQAAKPILDRTNYVKVALTGIQLIEQPERLEISTAIVGIIITYLTDGIPQEVTVDWELYTEQIQQVPASATDPAGPLATYLTPDDTVHTWTNYLKNYQLSDKYSVGKSLLLCLAVTRRLAVLKACQEWWHINRACRRCPGVGGCRSTVRSICTGVDGKAGGDRRQPRRPTGSGTTRDFAQECLPRFRFSRRRGCLRQTCDQCHR
jgi:hypothetical protein